MTAETQPRRTKIICTLGPASNGDDQLEALIRAGMDVARFNFSHGTHEDHQKVYDRLRAAEGRAKKPVAVLQDLQGPKIRLGKLDGVVELELGGTVVLSANNDFVGTRPRMPTTYERLARDVSVGERILLADGRVALRVQSIEVNDVTCKVEVPGVVSSSKGINLPGSRLSVPSLTEKDLADLEFGLKMGVDYVALSFVRSSLDVDNLREHMRRLGRVVPIISKIEKPEAVERLVPIVEASDGIMVARGDLGVEMPPEQVPGIQRRALRLARRHGKITVVATQMLMSMTKHPRPTHAEVSDVANAVFDGTDAVMLSDETAAGDFPVKAVETMAALAHAAQDAPECYDAPEVVEAISGSHAGAICRAAVLTASQLKADAIVGYTRGGLGPRLIAHWRPQCEILGCATTDSEVRRMAFYWGVRPLKIPPPASVEGLVSAVENATVDQGILPHGATIIITSKMPFTEAQPTNMLKIHTIERRR
ncbi:MAG: pyruvate kinase [Deltaproteobacteria bacterium]|nr:pyruvate kinase [Deltaproteobacteria bacterium]